MSGNKYSRYPEQSYLFLAIGQRSQFLAKVAYMHIEAAVIRFNFRPSARSDKAAFETTLPASLSNTCNRLNSVLVMDKGLPPHSTVREPEWMTRSFKAILPGESPSSVSASGERDVAVMRQLDLEAFLAEVVG